MDLTNKYIYLQNDIYKIKKITKSYIYINSLIIDNIIELKKEDIDFYKELPKFQDQTLKHYSKAIDDKQLFKIKKGVDYNIIDNIDDVYIYNNELKYNYQKIDIVNIQKKYYMSFNIALYFDKFFKINYEELREENLLYFIYVIKYNAYNTQQEDIQILKDLKLYDKYLILKKESETIFLRNKDIILNDTCPVCLCCDDIKQYKGFYKCNHSFCYDCYDNWTFNNYNNTCPLCRSDKEK